MSQVPLKRTPIAMSDYARALLRAWRAELEALPAKASAGVLWAQYMIETGGSACWVFNIGNVKVTPGQVAAGVDWFDLPGTWEIINGRRIVLPEGDPGRRFRAYASLDDAMVEHLRFLRNKRYKPAWPAVIAGDVMGFARMLKAAGYFTASANDYGNGMMWHFRKWMKSTAYDEAIAELLRAAEAPTEPQLPDEPDPDSTKIVDFAIVHPRVPLRGDPEDPPDDAA